MEAHKKYKHVILRADGNSLIGLGHVYRLLALAEMLKEDFDCFFAINQPDIFTREQIEKTCKGLILLKGNGPSKIPDLNKPREETGFDLKDHLSGDDLVVTDGYLFGGNYQLAVRATGAKLVCIDDLGETDFYADAVINHAPGINESIYKKQEYTRLFTGLNYAILREPFFKSLIEKDNLVQRAFISLGGSDFFGYSKKLLELLLQFNQFESLEVLCSSSFGDELLDSLKEMELASQKIKLHVNLGANEIAELLDNCTHAFVASSTVLIEAYARGLKCLTGFYSKNQRLIYDGFVKNKMAVGMGNFNSINEQVINTTMQKDEILTQLSYPLISPKKIKEIFVSII